MAASIGHQLVNQLGIGKGDRVAIAMRNYPEWMSAYIAITSIGAVVVPLNSWGQARDLEFALDDAAAKVVFCDHQRYEMVADWLKEQAITAVIAPEDLVMILYTSGTTGAPKGAVSAHRALCQALMNFEVAAYASAMINPETISAMMSSGFEPTQMLAVPLFHVSGLHAVFLTAFKAGRRVVMMYKWNAEQALELIESVRDDDGAELSQGVARQLWIKSPTVISEYWNRPDANARDFKDGLPDEAMGEQLAVAVVAKTGTSISEDEVRAFARALSASC